MTRWQASRGFSVRDAVRQTCAVTELGAGGKPSWQRQVQQLRSELSGADLAWLARIADLVAAPKVHSRAGL